MHADDNDDQGVLPIGRALICAEARCGRQLYKSLRTYQSFRSIEVTQITEVYT